MTVVSSPTFFFLRKGRDFWEFGALGKEKDSMKDHGRVREVEGALQWLLQDQASTRAS